MKESKLNTESILAQFDLLRKAITRAELPFLTEMLQEEILEVSMYELMKVREQAANMIKEIGYPRFEPILSKSVHYPKLQVEALHVCPYCGDPKCQSDHK